MGTEISKVCNVVVPLSQEESALCRDKDTIRVGDYFFHGDDLIHISQIKESEYGIRVCYDCVQDLERNMIYESYGSELLDEFIKSHRNRYVPDPNLLYQQAEGFSDGTFVPDGLSVANDEVSQDENASVTELATMRSASQLEAIVQRSRLLERRLDDLVTMSKYRSEVLRRRMQEKLNSLQQAAAVYRKQLKKALSVLSMIQLYLGEDQTVEQVLIGEPAGMDVPLTLHQQVLFMAEECQILSDGGIDASRIDEFVEWLKADNHVDLILPDAKGIVAMKPSRFTKQYGDARYEEMMRMWNRHTYFLVRNGGNVYLLESDHIEVSERMFPRRKEMQEIMDRMYATELVYDKENYQSELERKDEKYRRIVIFLQGLLDSTEILQPIRQGINLFNPDSAEGAFRLVYDDEPSLTDGHESFKDWSARINSTLKRGSRIVFVRNENRIGYGSSYAYKDFIERHFLLEYSEYTMPAIPESGVYTLEECETSSGKRLGFKYLPYDRYDWRKRSHRVTYLLSYDDLYLNYDRMSLVEVDYYLHARHKRKDYLIILPMMIEMRKELRKEQAEEDAFCQMLQGKLLSQGVDLERSAKLISEAIDWWKYKTITKRPIRSDDAKAMRMIEGRVKVLLSGGQEGE